MLFLPTISVLKNAGRGSLDFEMLKDTSFVGDVTTVFSGYTYGSVSSYGAVALFCGGLAFVLAISIILNKGIDIFKRVWLLIGLFFSILIFYWHPLFVVFSMFKDASSYWYRYSYVAIFMILFLALYNNDITKERKQFHRIFIGTLISSGVILIFGVKIDKARLVATVIIMTAIGVLYVFYRSKKNRGKMARVMLSISLLAVGALDLFINANFLVNSYHDADVDDYKSYHNTQSSIIADIKNLDNSYYRISQTKYYGGVNYNEALSYNYWSISGYTSSPDDNQRSFLERLGYRKNGENFNYTSAPVLATDSLLGVKYILSPYSINGLEKLHSTEGTDKETYINPYALPMAFTYNGKTGEQEIEWNENPFEYTNELYTSLFDIQDNIYTPIDYDIEKEENSHNLNITLHSEKFNACALYGNIPYYASSKTKIYANDTFITSYACWNSPSVFYIPNNNESEITIRIETDSDSLNIDNIQFYALNFDVLGECAKNANSEIADQIYINNNEVYVKISDGNYNQHLLLSIPADKGWYIYRNGQLLSDVDTVGGCLYSIDLVDGENEIYMVYHVPRMKAGIVLSVVAVAIIILYALSGRRGLIFLKKNKKE